MNLEGSKNKLVATAMLGTVLAAFAFGYLKLTRYKSSPSNRTNPKIHEIPRQMTEEPLTGWTVVKAKPDLKVYVQQAMPSSCVFVKACMFIPNTSLQTAAECIWNLTVRSSWDEAFYYLATVRRIDATSDIACFRIASPIPFVAEHREFLMHRTIQETGECVHISCESINLQEVPVATNHVRAQVFSSTYSLTLQDSGVLLRLVFNADLQGNISENLLKTLPSTKTVQWLEKLHEACQRRVPY